MSTDLSIYEGEDQVNTVTILDSSGTPIDITGYTFLFVVKNKLSDSDDNALIKKLITSHSDPTNGVTEITLVPADTSDKSGNYFYDYQWLDNSNDRRVVLKKANFKVEQRSGDTFS